MKRLIIMLLFSFFLVGCEATSTTTEITTSTASTEELLDYSDFPSLLMTEADQQLTQEYQTYYLYFYQETCYSCNYIKQEALSKIALLETDIVFLVEVHSPSDIAEGIGVTQTPSIVTVVDNEATDLQIGSLAVLDFIDSLT